MDLPGGISVSFTNVGVTGYNHSFAEGHGVKIDQEISMTGDQLSEHPDYGSLLGPIKVAEGSKEKVTVRQIIGSLEHIEDTNDPIHKITAKHTNAVMERIRLTPKTEEARKTYQQVLS